MVSVSIKTKNEGKARAFLDDIIKGLYLKRLDEYGRKGVDALSKVTPRKSGLTAASWQYRVEEFPGEIRIVWFNTNSVNGVPIAVILQYGHATRNGGYVEGIDYINPALKPIFDKLAKEAWRDIVK